MREIVNLLKRRWKEDFHPVIYVYTFLFLTVTISFNYYLDFEDSVLDSYYGSFECFVYYFIFYWVSYYAIAIPLLIIRERNNVFTNPEFWWKPAFFITLLSFSTYFHFHRELSFEGFNVFEDYYIRKLIYQVKNIVIVSFGLFLLWVTVDRNVESFYGLKIKNANVKPYFLMLVIMLPLIFIASFGADFQDTYPIFKPWKLRDVFELSYTQQSLLFEPLYGMSFFMVELLFRGAFVIGLARLLGRDAILPMVSIYAFLHFGKPLGETIGAIFGGYILGTIALEKRHIFGGCVIHIGVAWLMELTAIWQHLYR